MIKIVLIVIVIYFIIGISYASKWSTNYGNHEYQYPVPNNTQTFVTNSLIWIFNTKNLSEKKLDGNYSYDGGVLQKLYLDIKKIQKNQYIFSGSETRSSPLMDDGERYQMEESISGEITLTSYNKGVLKINESGCTINININTNSENDTFIIFEKSNPSGCSDWYDSIELLKTGPSETEL